jgi:hypothetical protein
MYRLLARADLRSFHGRSMFCSVVEKAVGLSAEDKQCYGILLMANTIDSTAERTIRKFRVTLTDKEHPVAVKGLLDRGLHEGDNSRLLHLLEVAAGVLFGSAGRTSEASVAPAPSPAASQVAASAPSSPPTPSFKKRPTASGETRATYLPPALQAIISSTVTRADVEEVDLGDLGDLFGSSGS